MGIGSSGFDGSDEPATTYVVAAGIATITLNEPASRNALSVALVSGLLGHLDEAEADDDVRAVVVTNTGATFCAGADLRAVGELAERGLELPAVFTRILDSPKPMVGRIAGHCRGGGVGLAAVFDVSVAADEATFAFSEVRLGVAPAIISVVCLPKMRMADATELFLRGSSFPAAKAAAVGLVNRAVPADELDGAIAEITADLLAGAPGALAAGKEIIRRVPRLDRDDAFAWATERSQALFAGAEGREGVAAFREKRAPAWRIDR